ncbi:tuftelin-interacting protein 11-like [Planoprotostelium fungivorum]|uniref:Tuftelin-interacting protein 11-like n=1 Tax=Planoprotostelium fungivorum TaxID=1890364 RepID=A0A2P6NUB1_9EUKA|nr:tuftelin-interacting protein 11-like [Planoprotostelium fungivorum]
MDGRRNGEGINRPIEVKLRGKRAGLGAEGSERTQQQIEDCPTEGDLEDKKKGKTVGGVVREKRWKKKTKKVTADPHLPHINVKKSTIIDMTGETSRVVDISQVATSRPGGGNFSPELTNNINMAEAELVTMENKRAQELKDKTREDDVLSMTHQEVWKKEEGLSYIKMILGKCKAKLVASEISLKDLGKAFELPQIECPEEYGKLDLPLLTATMSTCGEEELGRKKLTAYHTEEEEEEENDLYLQLCTLTVLPILRRTITTWDAKRESSRWKKFTTHLIHPKLQRAIENWDSSVDAPLVHRWIFLWLRHLTQQLWGLYPTIRQKMSLYLNKWKENNDSKDMVLPWKDLWNEVQMASVTSKLVPQLTTPNKR